MKNKNLNLPNFLATFRILLAPLMLWFMIDQSNPLFDGWHTTWLDYFAGLIFVIASITDFFDGYIARNWNQMTKLGGILDPLADKMLMLAGFIGLIVLDRASAFAVFLILSREFFITGLRVAAVSEGKELWCHQQAILIAAGIKVRFSEYNSVANKFVLKEGYNDFDIKFIRSYDNSGILTIPWRTHVQLTIGRWNGTDCDIEIDTWDEYCGQCYEDSVTNSILGLEDSATGSLNNTNSNKFSALKEEGITSLTHTIITLMNSILNNIVTIKNG